MPINIGACYLEIGVEEGQDILPLILFLSWLVIYSWFLFFKARLIIYIVLENYLFRLKRQVIATIYGHATLQQTLNPFCICSFNVFSFPLQFY